MTRLVSDIYDEVYAEKLWHWIPEVYRTQDILPPANGALRIFVEGLAKEAAAQRRSIDRLWDDMLVPFADDWAVAHIGSLLGTRMLSPLNSRGRRLDVVKTIAYRSRAGTPWLMEELVHDITGWHGAIVEGFATLARHPHNYDPADRHSSGRPYVAPGHYATPRAGRANLRRSANADLVDGAFDPFFHRPDLRKPMMRRGREMASSRARNDIGSLNIHIFRQKAYRVTDATPYRFDSRNFALDPSGRAVRLFKEGKRPFSQPDITRDLNAADIASWSPPERWQIPAPLECREFNRAYYLPTVLNLNLLTSAPAEVGAMAGITYETLESLRRDFSLLYTDPSLVPEWATFVDACLTENSPKANLFGDNATLFVGDPGLLASEVRAVSFAGQAIPPVSMASFAPEVQLRVDPVTGRMMLPTATSALATALVLRYHYGAFGDIGAGTYRRQETSYPSAQPFPEDWRTVEHFISGDDTTLSTDLATATDPLVYELDGNRTTRLDMPGDRILVRKDLSLVGQPSCRPYLRLEPAGGTEFVIEASPDLGDPNPCLMLDGIWLGLRPPTPVTVSGGEHVVDMIAEGLPTTPESWTLVLEGDFDRVVLRNVTLDPGGEALRVDPSVSRNIPAVRLLVRGYVSEIIVENSITGPIIERRDRLPGEPADPCSVTRLSISDSIIQSTDGTAALFMHSGLLSTARVTVLGDTMANRLLATETLFDGTLEVSDLSGSCLRFSGVGESASGRELPRPYESHVFPGGGLPEETFVSKHFGDAGYGQLALTSPASLSRGAENTSEMGAYHREMSAILLDDLWAKLDEFRPIHAIPNLIIET